MSSKSSPAVIGAFVLGAVALLVVGVIVFGGSELFTPKRYLVTYFQGSVKGLRIGSNVLFRGVRIGYVTNIEAVTDPDADKFSIPVTFQILPESIKVVAPDGRIVSLREAGRKELIQELVKRGLRSKLETESYVTGQLVIQLDFYPKEPAIFRGKNPPYPEVPSVPSDIQQVLDRLERFAASVGSKVDADKVLADIQGILGGLNRLANSPDLAATLAGLNKLVNAHDTQAMPGELRGAVAAFSGTMNDTSGVMKKLDADLPAVLGETRKSLASLNAALGHATGLLQETQQQLGEEGAARYELSRTLEEVQRAARSVRILSEYLELQPEALIRGKPDQKESP